MVGCLTSQQHASVSQGRICSDNFTCCHTEIEVAGPTFYLTQSQYTDTEPTSASADPIMPGAWQGSHWSDNFEVTGMTRPRKIPAQAGLVQGFVKHGFKVLLHGVVDGPLQASCCLVLRTTCVYTRYTRVLWALRRTLVCLMWTPFVLNSFLTMQM